MLTTPFSEWGFDSFAWLSGALWLLTGAGCSPRRASNFSLAREKSPKARFNAGGTRQNSLRAKGAPFGQPPRVSGFIRGVLRHFALLVLHLATARDAYVQAA